MRLKAYDYLFSLSILGIVSLYFSFYTLNVDSTWILYTSEQMLQGKKLYIDMVEVNPPLIFIYSLLAIIISKLTAISYASSYIILVIFLIFISLYLCFKILKKLSLEENFTRFYLYALIVILTLATCHVFGEREHLLLIFILPYILFSMHKDKLQINKLLLFTIIIFASLGLNLKPHFFLIFIAVELCLIFHHKKLFYFLRWDFFLLILSGLIYTLIIYIFFPQFFSFALPLALKTYMDLFNKSYLELILNYEFFIFFFISLFFIIFTKNRFSLDNKILIVSIIVTLIIYFIQQKGWFYHRLPFFSLTILFLVNLMIFHLKKDLRLYASAFLPIILSIIVINSTANQTILFELKEIINNLPKNSKIHILSTDIARGQVLLKKNQIWSSRFGALGILPYVLHTNDKKVKEYLFNSIYEDLVKYQPDTIIFCGKFDTFNYYNYFRNGDEKLKNIYDNNYSKKIIDEYIILEKTKVNIDK